jgi:hypothetical protein
MHSSAFRAARPTRVPSASIHTHIHSHSHSHTMRVPSASIRATTSNGPSRRATPIVQGALRDAMRAPSRASH